MNNMINIGAMVDNWRSTPGAIVHPKLSKAVDAARAALKANEMTDITERLRRIYVAEGANYVTEAADLIDKLRTERDMWKDTVSQRDRQILGLVNDVHSCGPTCTRAGCVAAGLREQVRDVATPRPWVGLTKDEVEILAYKAEGNTWKAVELAEAKLKEKNR